MKKKSYQFFKANFLILIVILLGVVLRVFAIDSIPPNPSLDEVSIGYNAYSIIKTGGDEFGERFPILLRAYDDWRPALYVYLTIPFVLILGLVPEAVRLPSVILSVCSLIASYFLFKELLGFHTKKDSVKKSTKIISLYSLFFMTISPWHVYFSRIGHEWSGALSFYIFALTFFFIGIRRNSRLFLLFSVISFGLSFDFYQSTKVIVPITVFILCCLFTKKILVFKSFIFVFLIAGFLTILPILISLTDPNALIRLHGTSIFESRSDLFQKSATNILDAQEEGNLVKEVVNNRRWLYITIPTNAYLTHFNPVWLFTNSGNEDFKSPGMGLLHMFEIPLLLIGLFFTAKTKLLTTRVKLFILFWILISPIPGSITTGYPHASRMLTILPAPSLLSGIGLFGLFSIFMKNKRMHMLVSFITSIFIIISVGIYIRSYFVKFPNQLSNQFQYGIFQAYDAVEEINTKRIPVVVDNQNRLMQAYMFYLFYSKKDPMLYQRSGGTKSGGFAADHRIDNYIFTKVDKIEPNKMYILSSKNELVSQVSVKKIIHLKNGEESLVVGENSTINK